MTTPLYFFSSNNIYFAQNEPIKVKIFWDFHVLASKFIKFFMSILKRQVSSSSNFASFFIVMIYNSSVSFKLIYFLLWIKGSHWNPSFEIFKCTGENLSYSLCHFPNRKLVFFQILHHSSVLWKTTPLYFFRSNVTYFAKKEPIKVDILRILSAQIKIHKILFVFETNQFCFKFCFSVMRHNSSSITLLAEILHAFSESSLWKYKFGEISCEQSKVWHFALWWVPFVQIL